ncbi:hypothetical protein KIP88_06570 [Bradyrhizobium sp. SRL28]|uniref:hypothetical protein n=1 Tax=Bradyrhizobium sp. SRL28 TaxID=2836178 RepID=UPI001BDEA038|nr:hypothetical protein [Bradyrhizobium sp. SRL28]MBT1510160.1 hypothetical protein [Bradyrhizobium sp. SRL28]
MSDVRLDCATTRVLSSRCEHQDREFDFRKMLPIISDAKLTNALNDVRAREIHLSQTRKRVFARAVRQALEPKGHVAITPCLRNLALSRSKILLCLLTNDLSLSTIDRQVHRATMSLSEIGCHRGCL